MNDYSLLPHQHISAIMWHKHLTRDHFVLLCTRLSWWHENQSERNKKKFQENQKSYTVLPLFQEWQKIINISLFRTSLGKVTEIQNGAKLEKIKASQI